MRFILCGFEHSIADAFYFANAQMLANGRTVLFLLLVIVAVSSLLGLTSLNWFLTTISYILLLALLVGGNLEFLMNNLDSMDLPVVISLILIGYVALIGLYLAIAYVSSAVRYGRARKRLREYVVKLRSLYRMK